MGGPTVVSRAVAVLGCFDAAHRHLSLTELAAGAGLPVSTAHRLVRELVAGGALARRPDGRYEVGARVEALGRLAPRGTALRGAAGPVLVDLAAATGLTALLGVLDGARAVVAARVLGAGAPAGSGEGSAPARVGARLSPHATALGRVLLARAPLAVVDAAVLDAALRDRRGAGAGPVADPVVVTRQLARVRRDGFAVTVDEGVAGASRVAVPVRAGGVVAALGLVVPAAAGDPAPLLPVLRVAAGALAREVDHDPSP